MPDIPGKTASVPSKVAFKTHLERFSKKVPLSYFNKKGLNEFIDYLRFTAELEEIEISALQGPVGHIGVSWDKLKFPEKWDQKWDPSWEVIF